MEKAYYKHYGAAGGSPAPETPPASGKQAHTAGLGGSLGALSGGLGNTLRNFALDDIILLALILFLINSDIDDNLPVILLIILFMVGFNKSEEETE
ncbi:MAG: hypothetical protein HFI90_04400 [Clostridia bacterium]|nr:hypothetical protein [Clostridia bacterium]